MAEPTPMTGRRAPVELPGEEASPLGRLGRRLLLGIGLVLFVAALTYLQRDGYEDPVDGEISMIDAFYYSSVSVNTTGYGDIRPVSDGARLVTTLLVTPAQVLFLVLLVGTTLEILAERTRTAYRLGRWRKTLHDHTIVCGYGTKGRNAISTLCSQGEPTGSIVVIDGNADARAAATAAGFAVVGGDASAREVLAEAGIERARAVVVAVDRDDTAVLVTLTARELNPDASIVAAVREQENVHLLHQGGADSVITTSGSAGRMLGLASTTPRIVEVLEDLIAVGSGLDIVEHAIGPEEAGTLAELSYQGGPVVAVVRRDEVLRFDDPRIGELHVGDKVVALRSHSD